MTYRTEGIIIKRMNLGEADRVLTILTKEHGKIKIIAKGSRKTLSKMAGHLELFYHGKFMLAEGKTFDILTEAQTINFFTDFRKDIHSTNSAFYFAEIIERLFSEREENPAIFDLMLKSLEKLNEASNTLLLSYFELNFTSLIGFKPRLYECSDCGKKLDAEKTFFNMESGASCCGGQKVSPESIKCLRLLSEKPIDIIDKIIMDEKTMAEVNRLTQNYIKSIHQEEFKSWRYLS